MDNFVEVNPNPPHGLVFHFKQTAPNGQLETEIKWGIQKNDLMPVFISWFNHLPEKDRKDILKELDV